MISLSHFTPSDLGLPDRYADFRTCQHEALDFVLGSTKRFVGCGLPTGCIAGTSEITLNRGGAAKTISIQEAWERQENRRSDAFLTPRIRAYVGSSRIGLHSLLHPAISYSGKKETLRLILRDFPFDLRATADHEIMTVTGWKTLSTLSQHDKVMVDSRKPTPARTAQKNKYKRVQGLIYHPHASKMFCTRKRGNHVEGLIRSVPLHRLVYEAVRLNGMPLEVFVTICRTWPEKAAELKFVDPTLYEVHHSDRNVTNNDPKNLECLTHEAHRKEHAIENMTNLGMGNVDWIPVYRVEKYKTVETFDARCTDPHHNFVANRIVVHNSGKTLFAAALAKATNKRTVILTITRGLQDQYAKDFSQAGMLDIRGKQNYECTGLGTGDGSSRWHPPSCRFGSMEGCRYHKQLTNLVGDTVTVVAPDCDYEGARKAFQWGKLGVTNYAYWIRANLFGRALEPPPKEGENPVEQLILDEAHWAGEALAQSLQIVLWESKLQDLGCRGYPKGDGLGEWREWVKEASLEAMERLEVASRALRLRTSRANRDLVIGLEAFVENCAAIARMLDDDWTLEMQPGTDYGRRWQFDCVWPGSVAESRLFLGVPRVVLISGTLRPQSLRMLNVPKEDSEFREWPRQFPAHRTPVYHVRTVRMNAKAGEEQLDRWVQRIDEIIESRGVKAGNKGLVHTVSYKRQQELVARSRFRDLMDTNTSGSETESAQKVFEKFKKADGVRVLVSPSFSTGWDFADDDCRYIIVAKMPFPDFRSKVMQARSARWQQYTAYLCAQELQQMAGRATRSEEDWAEVFVVDDSLTFFMRSNKALFADWFTVMARDGVPEMKLGR